MPDDYNPTRENELDKLVDYGIEQALIGNILAEPKAFDLVAWMKGDFFGYTGHAEIWDAIKALKKQGRDFGPHYLSQFFSDNPGVAMVGGADQFLTWANEALAPLSTSKDYAQRILSLHYRRKAYEVGEHIIKYAKSADLDIPPERILDGLEAVLAEARTFKKDDNIAGATETAVAALNSAKNPTFGINPGITYLQKMTGGFKPSQLIVVGGRPGMGKSAFGLTVAVNAAERNKNVLFFSLEMSKDELMQRVLSRYSRQAVHSGDIRDHEALEQATEKAGKLPLFIDDTAGITALDIAARASNFQRKNGLDLIVVDYLGLVKPQDTRANKVHQVEEVTQAFKNLAKSLRVPVLLLCQLSRPEKGQEAKRPGLNDLRDSGAIEQDADVVMFVYREEYYEKKKDERYASPEAEAGRMADDDSAKGKAEIIVAKQRQGRLDTVFCRFSGEHQYFYE